MVVKTVELAGQLVTVSAQEMTVETNVVKTVDVPKAVVDVDETAGVVSVELTTELEPRTVVKVDSMAELELEADSVADVETIELDATELDSTIELEAVIELEATIELLVVSTAYVELVLEAVVLTTEVVVAADEAGVVTTLVAFVVEALVVVEW